MAEKRIKILLVAEPGLTQREIARICKSNSGLQLLGTVTNFPEALAWGLKPDVILVDSELEGEDTISLIRLLTQQPGVTVVAMAPQEEVDYIRRAMLAGARGFLLRPFSEAEFVSTVRQIYKLATEGTAELAPAGWILAVFSPKGGVGKTTIATNLAVTLATEKGRRVALVDGDLQFGDVDVALNIHVHRTFFDLLPHFEQLDEELLESILVSHSSGIRVLLTPSQAEAANVIQPAHLERVLSRLRGMFDYAIVDSQASLDDRTQTLLDMANKILLVTTPDILTLRQIRIFLEWAKSRGYPPSKLILILNRAQIKAGIKTGDIESYLRFRIRLSIPDDAPLVFYSLNRGVPLVLSHRKSLIARSFFQLADLIAEEGR